MGVGLQGQRPCISQAQTFLRPLERGERGGAAAAPAGRRLPQEARAARSMGNCQFAYDAMRCVKPPPQSVEKTWGDKGTQPLMFNPALTACASEQMKTRKNSKKRRLATFPTVSMAADFSAAIIIST